eukprot:6560216-Prymnesium_polylepis.1
MEGSLREYFDSFAHSASVITKTGSPAAPAPRVGALSTVHAPTKRSGHRKVVDVRAGRGVRRARALAQCAHPRGYIFGNAISLHGFELCE